MSVVHVGKETVKSDRMDHGHFVVGAAAAQLSARTTTFQYGITWYASAGNAANIWIGKLGVTADNNAITGGFPLVPGSSITLPLMELQDIYAISTAAAQDLTWLGV